MAAVDQETTYMAHLQIAQVRQVLMAAAAAEPDTTAEMAVPVTVQALKQLKLQQGQQVLLLLQIAVVDIGTPALSKDMDKTEVLTPVETDTVQAVIMHAEEVAPQAEQSDSTGGGRRRLWQ